MIASDRAVPGEGIRSLASGPNTSLARRKAAELSAFFERLRQCLDDRGMSQADLARDLGVGVATVSEWFTRGRVPNGDVMLRLPSTLQVSGHWLLTGEGPRDVERRRGVDPYLRGVQDALAHVSKSLEETAHRFGAEAALQMSPGARPPSSDVESSSI
jgi:transcriptional regulator with XRE-family HTH domain